MATDIIGLARELFHHPEWAAFRRRREQWDRIRHQEEPVVLPELYRTTPFPQYRALDPAHQARVALQEMARADLRFAVASRSNDTDRITAAQRVENFLNRWWQEANSAPDAPFSLVAADQICRGLGYYKLDFDERALEADIGRRRQTPFVLSRVDPLTGVFAQDAEGGISVEWCYRPLSQLGAELASDVLLRAGEGRPDASGEMVEFIEVSTADSVYQRVRAQGVWSTLGDERYDNPFGAPRLVPVPAIIDPSPDPDRRYLPLIYAALEMAPLKSLFGTMRMIAAASSAFPVFDVVTEADGQAFLDPNTGRPMEVWIDPWQPMKVSLPAGTKLVARTHQAGADLDKMQAILDSDLRTFGLADVLAGGSQGEREPAWALALRGERAENPIRMLLDAQANAMRELGYMVLRAVLSLDEPISIWVVQRNRWGAPVREQLTIKPQDIAEDLEVDVESSYRSTATGLAKLEAMRRLEAEGKISTRRFLEEGVGLADPELEQSRIDDEAMDKAMRPFTYQMAMELAMIRARKELGLDVRESQVAAIQQGVTEATTPQPVNPVRPASPIHTTAEAPSIPGPDMMGGTGG